MGGEHVVADEVKPIGVPLKAFEEKAPEPDPPPPKQEEPVEDPPADPPAPVVEEAPPKVEEPPPAQLEEKQQDNKKETGHEALTHFQITLDKGKSGAKLGLDTSSNTREPFLRVQKVK